MKQFFYRLMSALMLLMCGTLPAASQFSITEVGNPVQFNALLTKRSASVSTRNIAATPMRITNTRNGVTTTRQTVQFSLNARSSNTSTKLGTTSVRDQISGHKQTELPVVNTANGFSVTIPEWFVLFPVLNEASSYVGPCTQAAGGREVRWIINGAQVTEETVSRPSQYEFFLSNPFPSTWTAQQVSDAIGGCRWVILRNGTLQFAVTPERVVQDIRRADRTITTPELLSQACKQVRVYDEQPADRLQNIFPRLEIIGNKLVNTSIINSMDWKLSKGVKSSSGQTLEWYWVVGVFNDCTTPDGPWSNQIGPSILDIGRCDWEFIPWDECTEYTLVATTGASRIDTVSKTIFYNPAKRTVFSLQLRQKSTDKGEDYNGYTSVGGFYSDSLPWFLSKVTF